MATLKKWKLGIKVHHIDDKFDGYLPYTTLIIVGKEQTENNIKCEIFDTYSLDEEVGADTKNMIEVPGFGYYAAEVLTLFMQDNEYIRESESLH